MFACKCHVVRKAKGNCMRPLCVQEGEVDGELVVDVNWGMAIGRGSCGEWRA